MIDDSSILTGNAVKEELEQAEKSLRPPRRRDLPNPRADVAGMLRELSGRTKMEQAWSEDEARYRLLAEAIPQLVWMAGPRGTLEYCNRYFQDITGLTAEAARESGEDVIHPDDRQLAQRRWAECSVRGEPYELEYRIRVARTGSYKWFLVRLHPIKDENGQPLRWIGAAVDIDAAKKAEEELAKQAAELARLNADLQQFASIASHDLQEPLRNMAICSELLVRNYSHVLDENGRQLVDLICSGAKSGQALTQALLSYARAAESSSGPLVPVSLEQPLGRALKNLKTVIAESNAVITHDALPVVVGDSIQLAQLLQNLIHNAIKYRGHTAPQIHISSQKRQKEWVIGVHDNGVGIPEAHRERIFEPFRRLHNPKVAGSGLGLATCKRIVQRHEGRIWVESEPGSGSVFFFTLRSPE